MKMQQPPQREFVCIQIHLFGKSEDLSLILSPKLSIYTKILLIQCLVWKTNTLPDALTYTYRIRIWKNMCIAHYIL